MRWHFWKLYRGMPTLCNKIFGGLISFETEHLIFTVSHWKTDLRLFCFSYRWPQGRNVNDDLNWLPPVVPWRIMQLYKWTSTLSFCDPGSFNSTSLSLWFVQATAKKIFICLLIFMCLVCHYLEMNWLLLKMFFVSFFFFCPLGVLLGILMCPSSSCSPFPSNGFSGASWK